MLAPCYTERRQGGWRPPLPSQQRHDALLPRWHGRGAMVASAAMLGDGASPSGIKKNHFRFKFFHESICKISFQKIPKYKNFSTVVSIFSYQVPWPGV